MSKVAIRVLEPVLVTHRKARPRAMLYAISPIQIRLATMVFSAFLEYLGGMHDKCAQAAELLGLHKKAGQVPARQAPFLE